MGSFRLIKPLMALFYCILIMQNIQAGEVESLYETSVLINNEEEKSNQKFLLNKAFTKVLLKITGSRKFLKLPEANEIINQSELLVQKFSFRSQVENNQPAIEQPQGVEEKIDQSEEKENKNTVINHVNNKEPAVKETGVKETNIKEKTWFWAHFGKQSTDQLLKKYHLAVWGRLRPETLIWLSIEQDHKRYIVSPANNPDIIQFFNKYAAIRGIPLLFPFGDLQDQNKLSVSDLWGNYSQAIQAASLRYHPQAVLATRIYQEPSGLWIAKWSLSVLNKTENWQSSDENVSVLLEQGIDILADKLVALFATRTDSTDDKLSIIQINNVTDFDGLIKVANYLKQIPAIQSANLIQVKGESLSYSIHYFGDEQHLIQSLVLGEVLQKVETSNDSTSSHEQKNNSEYIPVYLDQQQTQQHVNTMKGDNQKIPIYNKEVGANKKIQLSNIETADAKNTLPIIHPDVEFWLAR